MRNKQTDSHPKPHDETDRQTDRLASVDTPGSHRQTDGQFVETQTERRQSLRSHNTDTRARQKERTQIARPRHRHTHI